MALSIGIALVGYTLCTSASRTLKLEGITPLFDSVGAHVETDYRNPMNEISISGEGDLPDGLVAGENGGEDFAVSGITGGKMCIKDVTENASNEKYNSWSASAEHWPSAA